MTNKFIVEYTNKDIMDKLEAIEEKLDGKASLKLVYSITGFIATTIISLYVFCFN